MPILSQPTVHRLFTVTDPSPLPLDDQYGLNADLKTSISLKLSLLLFTKYTFAG